MFWAGILVTGWLGLVLVIAELIHAGFPNAKEWSRKVVHIGAGQVILIAYVLGVPTSWGIVAAAIASVITLLSHWVPIFPSISGVGRQSWGTFFLCREYWHIDGALLGQAAGTCSSGNFSDGLGRWPSCPCGDSLGTTSFTANG